MNLNLSLYKNQETMLINKKNLDNKAFFHFYRLGIYKLSSVPF